MSTSLQQPAFVVVSDDPAPGDADRAQPAAATQAAVHDDYCAIHDEYGTCTCGAAQLATETDEET